MPAAVAVLLVDPHPAMRATLRSVLSAEDGIAVVAAVAGFDQALSAIRRQRPRVALVDIAALEHRGMAGVGELLAADSRMAVLVIGVVDSPARLREARRHGAAGRVLKDAAPHEIAEAIRAAARGARRLRIVPPDS